MIIIHDNSHAITIIRRSHLLTYMSLKNKICEVLFSDSEELFRLNAIENNILDNKNLLSRTVLKPEEYKKFRQITGMPIDGFLKQLHVFFTAHYDEFASYDHQKKKWSDAHAIENKCTFPGCESDKDIQRDHIIPSSLNKTNLFPFTKGAQNILALCPFHNRVKTNSILLGIAFLMDSKE